MRAEGKPFRREGFPAAVAPVVFLLLATLSQTGMSLSQQGVAVVAVYVRQTFHLSLSEMGSLVSATSLGVFVGMTASGILVDKKGPRWLLAWGALFVALAAWSLSMIHGYLPMLGGLFFLGAGLSTMPSAGTRSVFDAFAGRQRGMVMGIRQTGVPLGSALSAALIPLTVSTLLLPGIWRAMGLVVALTGFIFVAVMAPWPPAPGPKPAPSAARPGLGELGGMVGPAAAAILMVAGQYSVLTFLIPDLHTRLHWSLELAGLSLALVQIGGGAARIGLGWVSDKMGGRRSPMIRATALAGAIGAALLAWLPVSIPGLLWIPVLLVLGVGTVGWNGLTLTWAGERVPGRRAGQAMSWTASAVFLGSAVYPPLFGKLVDATHEFRWAWSGLAVLLVVAFFVVYAVERRPAPVDLG